MSRLNRLFGLCRLFDYIADCRELGRACLAETALYEGVEMSDRFLLWKVLRREFEALHPIPPSSAAEVVAPANAGEAGLDLRTRELNENRRQLAILYRDIHALGTAEGSDKFPPHNENKPADLSGLPRSALCLSGGGIRSATFALGVLQSLAKHGLLDKFDYLSTVSGGGFIGSWLTAWINREPGGTKMVVGELAKPTDPGRTLCPEPEPIRHLREYSSYLSPRLGLFSADTWTLVAIYFRNLLLNWLVLIPLLVAVLMVPRIYVAALASHVANSARWGTAARWSVLCFGVVALVQSVVYALAWMPSNELKPNPANDQTRFLRHFWAPLLASGFLLSLFWWWRLHPSNPKDPVPPVYWWMIPAFAAGVFLVALLIYAINRKQNPPKVAGRGTAVSRFLYVIVAGSIAGAIGTWVSQWAFLRDPLMYACFAPPLYAALFMLSGVLYVGLASTLMQDIDREWWCEKGPGY